ncbi:MAG: hypothetical protein WCF85_18240 [Rhodospirillaceae bacterium]
MRHVGTVFRARYAPGSKSDHVAVMIRTSNGEFRLRRRGGNAFQDEMLEALVGKTISASGQLTETTLIMDEWSTLSEADGAPAAS